ncbi:MAG: FAD-dependent oxidoreductase [Actinobacteria bacterium]|nr:FAD-dependent oxidoreductase [Actinomycetota bacterium]
MAATVDYDAVVVGAGPNGLAAAITLAQSGASVLVLEAAGSPGGGTRSAELTLPGFVHDVCSAVHPIWSGTTPRSIWPIRSTTAPPRCWSARSTERARRWGRPGRIAG